jgi:DNA uptake protein ComE-like DNA-binding protein
MLRRTFLAASLVAGLVGTLPASFAAETARLNPNTATAEELAGIGGLDPALAGEIVAGRPFPTMVEFDALVRKTLSAEDAAKLYEQLFVPVNLNSGTEDEIALIPGMSKRMIREFLEYRPYADMSVFDREIGKYVDDAEVARLRSYVTL